MACEARWNCSVPCSSVMITIHWGFAWLAPLIFIVSMTKIKVQKGYINDNVELCPNIKATIWAMSSITLSPKAQKKNGRLGLSIDFLTQALLTTPHDVSWTHHSYINQLVQGFEISCPNQKVWEIVISVYVELWLWSQTLYLTELTSVISYSGLEMIWDIFLKMGNIMSFLLWMEENLFPEFILFKMTWANTAHYDSKSK